MQALSISILALDGLGYILFGLRSLATWCAMTSRALAFAPMSEQWLAELARAGRSVVTIACYRLDLAAIGSDVEGRLGLPAKIESLAKIGQAQVDELDRIWTANGLARSTTLRRFATLRGVAAAAAREIDCSAILSAALPLQSPREMRAASDRDVEQMLDLPMATWTDARDAAVLKLMSETGATSVEVAALDCSHWWEDAASLALGSASPAARIVSLSQTAVEALAAYRGRVPFSSAAGSPLFLGHRGERFEPRTIQVMLSRRSAQAGLPVSVTSMMLRHRRGRQLAADGRSPQQVAQALGISVATAVKYFALQFDHLRPRKLRGQRGRSARPRRVASPSEAATDRRSQGGRHCS